MDDYTTTTIIIIIESLINSAALKKLRRAAGICDSVLRNRCAFRCRAKVAVDSDERRRSVGRLFQMSGRKQQSSYDRWLWLSVAHLVCLRQPTSDADVPSKLNHRLAKLSQIRGASPRRHLLTSIAILYFIRK